MVKIDLSEPRKAGDRASTVAVPRRFPDRLKTIVGQAGSADAVLDCRTN